MKVVHVRQILGDVAVAFAGCAMNVPALHAATGQTA
jgi:hypothetical protein